MKKEKNNLTPKIEDLIKILTRTISKLKKMHEDGVITQEEFKKAKEKILK